MELELNRVDYCFVGTTLRNCLKLLPNGYKQQQQVHKEFFCYIIKSVYSEFNYVFFPKINKVAVGDQDGVVQVFSIKKQDTQIHFKTLPTGKVSAVQLGGIAGTGIYISVIE